MAMILAASGTATAEVCTTSTGLPSTFVMELPSKIVINPDAAVGTTLADIRGSMQLKAVNEIRCPTLSGLVPNVYTLTSGAYLGNNLYDSGIPGVGIMYFANGRQLPFETPYSFPYTDVSGWTGRLLLVKTGPITQSGSLAGLRGGGYLTSHDNYEWRSFQFTGGTNVDAGRPTCRVVTPTVPVPMPKAMLREFGGIGSTLGEQGFKISLDCSGGRPQITTAVRGVLMDQSDPSNRSTALSLSPGSTASGVGVQVLHGGQVLSYGGDGSDGDDAMDQARWFAGRTGNGRFDIPMSARYVQTLPQVTPGSANAKATFVLSYE